MARKRLHHHLRIHVPAVLTVIGLTIATLAATILLFPDHATSPQTEPISKISPLAAAPFPSVSAQNIFISDLDTGEVLYEKDADVPLYPASTTKIVTGLVAMAHFPLDQVITITRSYPSGQNIGLKPGDSLTVENLLYALLIDSANDAAEVLAENYPGGREGFVAEMNRFVKDELKLKHTNFKNPHGLDEAGHYSSASDLARIASYAMKNDLFARIVSTETTIISTVDHDQIKVLANTNELLGKTPGVLGIKTGFTDLAGQSVITLVKRDNKTLVFVVMGSADRFGDTKALIDWAYFPVTQ